MTNTRIIRQIIHVRSLDILGISVVTMMSLHQFVPSCTYTDNISWLSDDDQTNTISGYYYLYHLIIDMDSTLATYYRIALKVPNEETISLNNYEIGKTNTCYLDVVTRNVE